MNSSETFEGKQVIATNITRFWVGFLISQQCVFVCFFDANVFLVDARMPFFGCVWFWLGFKFFLESLILAQDERWRRA